MKRFSAFLELRWVLIVIPMIYLWPHTSAYAGVCSAPSYGTSFSSSGYQYGTSYGGVSLDKTADLMLNINDIAGATYDDATGQIILYGKTNTSLPDMDLDDLSVAVRSLFGYGGVAPQAPGVSIGTEPSGIAGKHLVRYDGQTENTRFGEIMFDADWVLKGLGLGQVKEDNGNIRYFQSNVPGYKNMVDRYQDAKYSQLKTFAVFIKPKDISLTKSNDGTAMIFDNVSMEVVFEDRNGSETVNPHITDHITNLTNNFDTFANQHPSWKEIKRLGKITGLVKWIRDNNIPFDFSRIAEHEPAFIDTPELVNTLKVDGQFDSGNLRYSFTLEGGVVYRLDSENFSEIREPEGGDIGKSQQMATFARGEDADFQWEFTANDESYTAVAHSLTRAQKDGNVTWGATDFSFPARGDLTTSLSRKYDSFDPEDYGFGVGWEIVPYRLRVVDNKRTFPFNNKTILFDTYDRIFVKEPSREREYRLIGLDADQKPLFLAEGGQDVLRDNLDGTFTVKVLSGGEMNFNAAGRLTSIEDRFGESLVYTYNSNGILTNIAHSNGDTIGFTVTDDLIRSATGPGNTVFTYGFDSNGNLHTVTDQESQVVTYDYSVNPDPLIQDLKLSKVTDARGNPVLEVTYDVHNRADSRVLGSSNNMDADFNLGARMSKDTDTKGVVTTKMFDPQFRLIMLEDDRGRLTDLSYDTDFGPSKITDPRNNETIINYDAHGNPRSITSAENDQSKLTFNQQDVLVVTEDPKGRAVYNLYDDKNQIDTIFHHGATSRDPNDTITQLVVDTQNTTQFTYDDYGNVASVTDARGNTTSYTHNERGQVLTTTYPSGYVMTMVYDLRGRVERVYDAVGDLESYTYDNVDRVKTRTTPSGTVSYNYDGNGNVTEFTDGRGYVTQYEYDADNRLTKTIDPYLEETVYQYDSSGAVKSIELPNGGTFGTEFNDLNQPEFERSIVAETEPRIAVRQQSVDFGVVNQPVAERIVEVFNLGFAPLEISNATATGGFTVTESSIIIAPGEVQELNLSLSQGLVEATFSGVLTIESNDARDPVITVDLLAKVEQTPLILDAVPVLEGISLSWSEYTNHTAFSEYRLYRSETAFSGTIDETTQIYSSSSPVNTTYLDEETNIDELKYYYALAAFDANGERLSNPAFKGPIGRINLGQMGSPTLVDGVKSIGLSVEWNSVSKEYLVAFVKEDPNNSTNTDIYGQRYDRDGAALGTEFSIFDSTFPESNPDIAYNSINNEYLVVAETEPNSDGISQIRRQRIDFDGTKIGSETQTLNSLSTQTNPVVVYNPGENQYLMMFSTEMTGDQYLDLYSVLISSSAVYVPESVNWINATGFDFVNPAIVHNPNSGVNEYVGAFTLTDNATIHEVNLLRLNNLAQYINNSSGNLATFVGPSTASDTKPSIVHNSDINEYLVTFAYPAALTSQTYVARVNTDLTTGGAVGWVIGSNYSDIDSVAGYSSYLGDYYTISRTKYDNTGQEYLVGRRWTISGTSLSPVGEFQTLLRSSLGPYSEFEMASDSDSPRYMMAANTGSNNLEQLEVQLLGEAGIPKIRYSPAELDFGSEDTELTVNFDVYSFESVSIYGESIPWLSFGSLTFFSSVGAGSMTIQVDRSGLTEGLYTDEIRLRTGSEIVPLTVTMWVGNAAPSPVSYVAPLDDATGIGSVGYPVSASLSWEGSDPNGDSLTYDVYLGTDSSAVNILDPSLLVGQDLIESTASVGGLEYSQEYFWKVVSKDPAGLTGMGEVSSFTTKSADMPSIVPLDPPTVNLVSPVLNWDVVDGVLSHYLQVSDNQNFITPNFESTVALPPFELPIQLNEGKWYWRVASISGNDVQGDYSEIGVFEIDTTAPNIPTGLLVPDSPTANTTPVFTWNEVTDAVRYRLQLSQEGDFSQLSRQEFLESFEFQLIDTVDDDIDQTLASGDWFARVSAIDEAGNESGFSTVGAFTVDSLPPGDASELILSRVDNHIQLDWGSSAVDSSDFADWVIYRSESAFSDVAELAPLATISTFGTTQYVDSSVQIGVEYFYAITTQDSLGNQNLEIPSNGPFSIPDLGIKLVSPSDDIQFVAGQQLLEISWTDDLLTSNATISLYYDTDNLGHDGVLIAGNIDATADQSGDTYLWDTTGIPFGTYYLYAQLDEAGSIVYDYASGSIRSVDGVPPVVTPPADLTVEAVDVLTPVQLGTAVAIDNLEGPVSVTADFTGPFSLGSNVITWSAADSVGNTGTATQTVTIVDTTPPVFVAPSDVDRFIHGPGQMEVELGEPEATDIFDVTFENDAPEFFDADTTTTVTWTATDQSGNTVSDTQEVTVTREDINECRVTSTLSSRGNTSQSTTGNFPAANATNTDFLDFSQTESTDTSSSWELSFTSDMRFDNLVLHNRSDCCGERLRDITVIVEDGEGNAVYSSELLNPENIENSPAALAIEFPTRLKGQKIVVSRVPDPDHSGSGLSGDEDANVLSLAEIEVQGCKWRLPETRVIKYKKYSIIVPAN